MFKNLLFVIVDLAHDLVWSICWSEIKLLRSKWLPVMDRLERRLLLLMALWEVEKYFPKDHFVVEIDQIDLTHAMVWERGCLGYSCYELDQFYDEDDGMPYGPKGYWVWTDEIEYPIS